MRRMRLFSLLAILALLISLTVALPTTSADGDSPPPVPPKHPLQYPNLGSHLSGLAEGYEAGQITQSQAASETPISSGGSIAVTIYLSANVDAVVSFLEDNGGDSRNVGEDYIEAYVPVSLLGSLSQQPGVIRVREIIPPEPAFGDVTSQGVAAHLATAWHEAGITGEGVKVGVIDTTTTDTSRDGFTGLHSLMGTELPSSVVGLCFYGIGQSNNDLDNCDAPDGDAHGTVVAEAVMDIAPGATLYIANPVSKGDLRQATEWMSAQGVQVINYSVGWTFDGPGDGTSPDSISPLNTVDWAVENGIIWVNSAGNAAQDTWFGPYSNPDGNRWVNFHGDDGERNYLQLPANDETVNFVVELRWEDSWRGATSDLDLFLYEDGTTQRLVASSEDLQSRGLGDNPHEYLRLTTDPSPLPRENYYVAVSHELGDAPEWIQVRVRFFGALNNPTESGSISNPAESANPGMLAVGAAHYWDTSAIADYSSQGPTPDGRVKPDIAGVACADSVSYVTESNESGAFCGTSQASPHVAGLAALVLQQNPGFTPEQVASYLKNSAAERGAAGPDNVWGHGFAELPAPDATPPTGADCVTALTADGQVSGTWAAGCDSEVSGRGHAQYYTFTLAQQSDVTITLESADADTYLYLRSGDDVRSGAFLYENDDDGGTTKSTIEETLAAGTYTIEATTYEAGETGDFTLTVTGLGGGDTTSPAPGSDPCVTDLDADGTVPGTWAPGCDSEVSGRGHAQYYTFTLAQQSDVTITLESSEADTYLYLRSGDDARSGAFLYENDDDGGTTKSTIEETLAAGTYTIEATTYEAGETGAFTLTVAGLGGSSTTPPVPGSDPCVTPITADGTVPGSWAAGCDSQESGRGYARWYTFTLAQESDVTITLESSDADTYLYLRSGDDARSGAFLYENDDDGGTTKSTIEETLSAGTYTIEATTYEAGETGAFTLTVAGLGGSSTTPPVPGSDPCVTPITADGPVPGTWAAGCDSEVSGRGHAQYYTFTLAQQSDVTITLESSDADTYLYLRSGDDARSGTFLYENDDDGGTTKSTIEETLAAGTYTIEATTYAAGETGDFTLTVTGLGAAAQAACSVGQTLSPGESCSHQDFTIAVESNGDLSLRFSGSAAPPQGLDLSRNGNTWTINSLP